MQFNGNSQSEANSIYYPNLNQFFDEHHKLQLSNYIKYKIPYFFSLF